MKEPADLITRRKTKMKSRTVQCMKFFLTGFNIICILFSILVMAICTLDLRMRKTYSDVRTSMSEGAAGFLITLGVFLAGAGILGIIGALREGRKTLYTYAAFLIVLVCIELTVAVGAAVFRSWTGSGQNLLRQEFFRNITAEDARHIVLWDTTQSQYQCCGVDGPSDYSILHRDIPASCCPRANPLHEGRERRKLHSLCLLDKEYYLMGCERKIAQSLNKLANFYIGIGVFIGLIEVLCIVLSIWMSRKIRSVRKKLQQNLQQHFES